MMFFLAGIIPREFHFDWLDWLVIIIYFAGLIYMSVKLGEGQENQEDYYVGGRDLPWWAIGLSTMATQTSAISFISIPAFVALRKGGGLRWLQYELAVPLAMIFIMVFFIPFFRQLKLVSVYKYLEDRFSPATRYFLSGVFLLSRGIGTAFGLYAAAIVLSVCFNLHMVVTIFIIGIVTLIYDTIGGMKAVVYSDVVQMGILVVGIFLCCFYALKDVGGIKEALQLFPREQLVCLDFKSGFNGDEFPFWAFLIGGFFLYSSYYGCDQSQTQRELSAPTIDDTKKSLFFNGFFRFPLTILYILMGILVGAYFVKNADFAGMMTGKKDDFLLPIFIMTKIPHGIKALIFSAMLAAAMSSLDSSINSLSAASMRDFLEKFIDFGDDHKKYLWYSKAATVFWGLAITIIALFVGRMGETIVEAINKVGSAFYGPILAAFLLGVAFRKVNSTGVIAGITVGVLFNVFLWKTQPQISFMWWNAIGCGITVIVAVILSLIKPETKTEKIKHLIIWDSPHTANEKAWIPKYLTLVVYFFIMLLIAYFLPIIIKGIN